MSAINHLHPALVHLPLGLWVTVAPLYSAARYYGGSAAGARLASVATVNLVLGSLLAVVALFTGLLAVSGLTVLGAAQVTLTHHITWAVFASLLMISIALLRSVGRPLDELPGTVMLACLWLALIPVVYTGYYGGLNVYSHALGVDVAAAARDHIKPLSPSPTAPPTAP